MIDAWEKLTKFVAEEAGEPIIGRLELTRDTDLYHDLDMNPDHIERLVRRWAVTFNVDISAFNIYDYYPSAKLDIGAFLATVIKSPFSAKSREMLGGRLLTLGALEHAMQRGWWEA